MILMMLYNRMRGLVKYNPNFMVSVDHQKAANAIGRKIIAM